MSSPEHEPTNYPVSDAKITPLGYILGVQFHGPLKLVRQQGLEFGAKLSAYVDARGVDLQDSSWTFSQPLGDSAAGLFRVTIQEEAITLEARMPTSPLEWFEDRYGFILDEFQKSFKPAFVISSTAKVMATIPVDGDARAFLFEHVANMPPERLNPLGRPLHIFGMRLGMPPFQLQMRPKGGSKKGKVISTEWSVDVKVESLAVDTRQLYLEVTGQWPPNPKAWDGRATKESVARLATVKEYLEKHVLPFLKNNRSNGSNGGKT
jgi:hypothetical protein